MIAAATEALSENGEDWRITASSGSVSLPDEAPHAAQALHLVHQRMYADKRGGRASPVAQARDVLLRAVSERWDGGGYPDGLAGEEIPVGARIVAVCDAWDAMVSDRAYRIAATPAAALAELRRCAGTQFDPAVVAALAEVLEDASLESCPVSAWPPDGGRRACLPGCSRTPIA
ncbi:HD domain-containing phosphohydrolase [Capillimicrobium parvum]|uniref:HD-GYP domain-containing protein n=1 Tax=Capillimicrobium parvum TaxID=2884022 RepID=A0A9E7C2P9_9ACTN|nr:hypothetical protein DSM104329_04401 [Capillimicrobium parvum]